MMVIMNEDTFCVFALSFIQKSVFGLLSFFVISQTLSSLIGLSR